MKSNNQTPFYFSPYLLKAHKQEAKSVNLFNQSPYLKAVLTDKKSSGPARVFSMGNSSLAAALRYIANSK